MAFDLEYFGQGHRSYTEGSSPSDFNFLELQPCNFDHYGHHESRDMRAGRIGPHQPADFPDAG